MKIWLFLGLFIILLAVPINAKTDILTTDLNYDYSYTKNNPMFFSDGKFSIGKISIMPMISIKNALTGEDNEYNLSTSKFTFDYNIKDYGYKRKWSLNFTKPLNFIGNINYLAFNVSGCKQSSDYVLQCSNIEIDFTDIKDSGFDVSLKNDKVIVSNALLLLASKISLDPTDQLLLNITNKAYLISSTTTDSPAQATTEFSSAQYNNINTSNNAYVTSTAQETIQAACGGSTGSCNAMPICDLPTDCYAGNCVSTCPSRTQASGSGSCSAYYISGCKCSLLFRCSGTASCGGSGICSYTCNSGYYDTDGVDGNGCESTIPSWIYTFQRFTFNISNYTFSSITSLQFCWEGKYSSTGGSYSSNLLWFNNTSATWSSWQILPYNSENTYCVYFDSTNKTDIYNSTSGLVQFAVRGNQSKTGHTLTLSSDFAYLNVTYSIIAPISLIKCEYFCYPFKEVNNKELMEIYQKTENKLGNKYLIENLQNEQTENNCKIFWYNSDYKDRNFCINLYSKKAIILSDNDENNNIFIDWLMSIFHSVFG
jgi:hypothetical protein